MLLTAIACLFILTTADYPLPVQGDYTIRDFRFTSGETLPELRMHYTTVGTPRRDARGVVNNAVLIMHGTTGNGARLIRPEFAGELFGKGQPLDAERYYIIPVSYTHLRAHET